LEKVINSKGDIILPIERKKCSSEDMKVIIENGFIGKISKKISNEKATGEFIGVAKISKHALAPLKNIVNELMTRKSFDGFFEAALQIGVNRGIFKLKPLDITGLPWVEIDFEKDYEKTKILFP